MSESRALRWAVAVLLLAFAVLLSGTSHARTFTYDAAGNVTHDGTNTWKYDGANRPHEVVTPTGTVRFEINALGQRVKKTSPLGITLFMHDETGKLVGEYDGAGRIIQEIVWLENLPIATIRPKPSGGTEVFYIHADHLGTPRAITRPSDNKLVWKWDNTEPFGNSKPNENPSGLGIFKFNLRGAGQYYDQETGYLWNGHRVLDPRTGRYLQSDPIGLAGGISTYGHVYGNPLIHTDPDGLVPPGDRGNPGGIGGGNIVRGKGFGVPANSQLAPDGATLFRGGNHLAARLGTDVRKAADGLIHPLCPKTGKPQGISLNLDPKDHFVQYHGGAFPVNSLPMGLQAVQTGKPGHYVVSPTQPMTFERYEQLLNQIQLGNLNLIK